MEAINAMKKKGQNVNLIERKVAKQAVKQAQGQVDHEEAAIERALAESKALYVSLEVFKTAIGTRREVEKSLLRASRSGAGARKGQDGKASVDLTARGAKNEGGRTPCCLKGLARDRVIEAR